MAECIPPAKLPKDTKLLRLASARLDVSYSLDAYDLLRTLEPDHPVFYHCAVSMAVCYGRPFAESNGLGKLTVDYPAFPDFSVSEMNERHRRLIDLRNKFMAHSSCEGTRLLIVPPGSPIPGTGEPAVAHDHLVGKRMFGDVRFCDWLSEVVIALKSRLDMDVRARLAEVGAALAQSTEMETGYDTFQWTASKK